MATVRIQLEREVQKVILEWLKLRGIMAWRNNVGIAAGSHKGKRWFMRFGFPGMSDIIGIMPDGRFLAIEVKRPGRKPTGEQCGFLTRIRNLGGVAFWADSLDMVIDMITGELSDGKG